MTSTFYTTRSKYRIEGSVPGVHELHGLLLATAQKSVFLYFTQFACNKDKGSAISSLCIEMFLIDINGSHTFKFLEFSMCHVYIDCSVPDETLANSYMSCTKYQFQNHCYAS